MKEIKEAWEKFANSGKILDYLSYRREENKDDELLNCLDIEKLEKLSSRGTGNEIRSPWNNNKRKRF